MIAVANGMMHLYGQGKHTFAVAPKILAHGENGQKEFAFIIYVDVESREFEPRNHGDVEGIDWCSVLGRVACGRAVYGGIFLIASEERVIILREIRPNARKVLVFLIENGVHGVHIVIDAQPLRGQRRAEFRHIVDGFRQQPNHGGIQLLPFEIGDIEVDRDGIGAYHLTDEVLVELLALPVFDVDQFECHDYAFLQ